MTTKAKETTEHRSWRAMIERCENPRHIGFQYYGARGVKVCPSWRASFAAFLEDMGLKPSPKYTIDRWPDHDGDYEPTNCRWATAQQQRLNQRPYDESNRVRKSWESQRRSRISRSRIDLKGHRFGRLLVVGYAETRGKRAAWHCICDCGTGKIIAGTSLRKGNTTSCGCYTRQLAAARAVERNKTDNPAFKRWRKL